MVSLLYSLDCGFYCNKVFVTFFCFIRYILFSYYVSNKERITRDFWSGDCCFYKQVVTGCKIIRRTILIEAFRLKINFVLKATLCLEH